MYISKEISAGPVGALVIMSNYHSDDDIFHLGTNDWLHISLRAHGQHVGICKLTYLQIR